jgi:hypothetical protein
MLLDGSLGPLSNSCCHISIHNAEVKEKGKEQPRASRIYFMLVSMLADDSSDEYGGCSAPWILPLPVDALRRALLACMLAGGSRRSVHGDISLLSLAIANQT